jgi:hypothetical protein
MARTFDHITYPHKAVSKLVQLGAILTSSVPNDQNFSCKSCHLYTYDRNFGRRVIHCTLKRLDLGIRVWASYYQYLPDHSVVCFLLCLSLSYRWRLCWSLALNQDLNSVVVLRWITVGFFASCVFDFCQYEHVGMRLYWLEYRVKITKNQSILVIWSPI